MKVVGVLLIGAGVYLMYYAWESHKNQTPVTPLTRAQQAITGSAPTALTAAQQAALPAAEQAALATAAVAGG